MQNIRVEAKRDNYMVVLADTERFGKDEVMFEGNTFDQCFNFIKRETGRENLQLRSMALYETVTDRNGRTFPHYMEVC